MTFTFDKVMTVDEARERFATTRDTMLSQVCADIVEGFNAADSEAIGTYNLDELEMMSEKFQNWQIRQRDRRANPQEEGDDKAQVISVDAIARKINADTEKTDVRAVRRNGGLLFVRDSVWTPEEGDDTEGDAS
jgi:hypothetical protein